MFARLGRNIRPWQVDPPHPAILRLHHTRAASDTHAAPHLLNTPDIIAVATMMAKPAGDFLKHPDSRGHLFCFCQRDPPLLFRPPPACPSRDEPSLVCRRAEAKRLNFAGRFCAKTLTRFQPGPCQMTRQLSEAVFESGPFMSIDRRSQPVFPLTQLPHVATTLGLSALILIGLWPLTGNDMASFLLPWFDHIVATGPVASFSTPFSNYSPPYLYLLAAITPFSAVVPAMTLIKLLSLLGTAALALAARHLLRLLGVTDANRAAALVFALPTVALNTGLMGQCDAMWAAPCLMALAAALRRRHVAMLAWCGLALAFKVQALLVAPFFLALLINRRVPIRLWPIMPLTTVIMMLPAWAAGWPAADLATVYLRQADTYDGLALKAPNIWAILQELPLGGLPMLGLALAAAIGASVAYIARFSTQPLTDRTIVSVALLATLLTTGLLPRMHERYFFLADVLALIMALVIRDRSSVRIAVLVQAGSILGIVNYITGINAMAIIGAFAMIAATVQLARPLLKPAANDNPLIARTA
ncbi:hypothetical protein G4G27_10585 [Sphingomonas sp. So64.6b]|uniref:hypothetical protein n=1 Tax=Sphingomonas sp. So64.6b TaxID=2997354 RepID=UPI001602010A|nr:hypothetical protein [Sphingomonas sp. So64.6b]QNA84385.1 hypothetical protein G4G27_10585 [Sphingomonas sp. So64.6b]